MARHRPPSLRRSAQPTISAKPLVTVFCEGKNSEPHYLKAFARTRGAGVVDVHIEPAAGVPLTLVRKAKAAKAKHRRTVGRNSFAQADQFWVAFDCDQHPGLQEARADAADAKIEIAFSNPCFELWILLHLPDAGVDRPWDRHEIQKELSHRLTSYNHQIGKNVNFSEISSGYEIAVNRAWHMRRRREEEDNVYGNPFTSFDRLTSVIDGGTKR